MTNWELHGMEFGNCNCAYACGCQFNALPTHGHCQAVAFFRIDHGHFGGARLDNLNMAMAASWPGPVHEGHGVLQPIIDQRADGVQRAGMLSILTGKDTAPMATFWAVFAAMCETIHEPIYTTINIDLDMNARRATCQAAGVATGRGEPILNPVTGHEHRVGILLPEGFEFERNEVGRGWSTCMREVAVTVADTYAHWCELHFNQDGRIRQ